MKNIIQKNIIEIIKKNNIEIIKKNNIGIKESIAKIYTI